MKLSCRHGLYRFAIATLIPYRYIAHTSYTRYLVSKKENTHSAKNSLINIFISKQQKINFAHSFHFIHEFNQNGTKKCDYVICDMFVIRPSKRRHIFNLDPGMRHNKHKSDSWKGSLWKGLCSLFDLIKRDRFRDQILFYWWLSFEEKVCMFRRALLSNKIWTQG